LGDDDITQKIRINKGDGRMDIDALKTDLDLAFRELPPEVLGELSRLVLANKEVFAVKLPKVLEGLAPHIKAGMMEFAMGIFQMKEVEDAVMEVLGRHGVKPGERVFEGEALQPPADNFDALDFERGKRHENR
jgi:hypothetical protein